MGARPQFVKASVLSREIEKRDNVEEIIVHTGQHFDKKMSDVFFEELCIPKPHYNLDIHGGGHGEMTGRMLQALESVLSAEVPDLVLVFGDTNSTLAGALAAAKLNISVAHVEAGLRSFNRTMPEEINRVLTDHVSDYLMCPTTVSKQNLLKEGLASSCIYQVGDVMFDAVKFYGKLAHEPSWIKEIGLNGQDYYLATLHRAENTDDPEKLTRILSALSQVDKPVLLPLHPRTSERMKKYSIHTDKNIVLTGPVSFLEMAWLEANSIAIATDSGGVQKEAFFHRKHCVILREETEWTDLVKVGAATLVGSDEDKIKRELRSSQKRCFKNVELFGDGRAGQNILDVLSDALLSP